MLVCVLGECLVGALLYCAETVQRMVAPHLLESAPWPGRLRPGMVPATFDDMITKGVAENSVKRYTTVGYLGRSPPASR
ncbi:hypothetical protein DIJ64_04055 [Mycobacterium leprae]|uniref:Uncharacterized protein n=1 Tax=Mycobacterium leprae TaxID=1769 RepID=A0AAD0KQK4_MYCLR|nr:hypothetical protein DIJ64_04055 [Mycobacterium leprae]OAR21758.1 hypothetical protein A8144_00750 [Mycobacterium leprae 3125609]OAX72298.1 hypothetical protein A3216_00815 [Mycobacterium leprae 7935681]